MNKRLVLGFPISIGEKYGESIDLDSMSDAELYEEYKYQKSNNEDVKIYQDVRDFFTDMNNDNVDTENMYWYFVELVNIIPLGD